MRSLECSGGFRVPEGLGGKMCRVVMGKMKFLSKLIPASFAVFWNRFRIVGAESVIGIVSEFGSAIGIDSGIGSRIGFIMNSGISSGFDSGIEIGFEIEICSGIEICSRIGIGS